jgi:nucleotide-binding universal stress UspA family protein
MPYRTTLVVLTGDSGLEARLQSTTSAKRRAGRATLGRSCLPRRQRTGGPAGYGYLRSRRLRELVFGGATRHVLREATLPVLFGS